MKRSFYFNGEILTMADPLYTEAVLVEDGIIIETGNRDDVIHSVTADTEIVNLNGAVLLPGFIDSHSHIAALAQSLGVVNLASCRNFRDIREKIQEFANTYSSARYEWIVGFDYGEIPLEEGMDPNKTLLDEAAPGCRVAIVDSTRSAGVMSSAALDAVGVTEHTPDPAGGQIRRLPGSMEPNGYLSGTAFQNAFAEIDPPSEDWLIDQLDQAQKVYAQHGITTVQEGLAKDDEWAALRACSDSGRLQLDVVAFVDPKEAKHLARENLSRVQRYKRHLKLGGYKLIFDGYLQDRTAWMTTPYQTPSSSTVKAPHYSDEEAELLLFESLNDHMQVLVHCNGDGAAEQMISVCERITDNMDVELRPVMVHALAVRPDQLRRMAHLGIMASFFVPHIFYWGDTHIENLGPERADLLCPTQSAKQTGVHFTLHQDTPTLLPNMLSTVWSAVNRVTRRGVVLGEEEQVSTLDALRAVTIEAAYQYFEEHEKGSIEPGKRADFTILDFNPLRVRPKDIKRIRVLKTIKDGRVIYERD